MDFLKPKFNDYLNTDGTVDIAGYTFYRDEILKTMDEDAYKQVFDDWVEARNSDLLEKADEILETYGARERFNALIKLYKNNKIIPFVGAGMSIPSGYPGWTKFLYRLREETTLNEEHLEKLLDTGEYELAAQLLYENMPPNSFNEELENRYYCDNDISGAVQYLPYIFNSCPVITTNFDNVLERCYDNANVPFTEILSGSDSEELPRLIITEERLLLKLHGKANSSRNRILLKSEYDEHYSNSSILRNAIETIISSKSLLFLGCSLSIDRTIKIMMEIVEEKGADRLPRHYALIGLKDESEKLIRRNELAKANIYPIWYDANDNHDECIESLFLKLYEEGNRI